MKEKEGHVAHTQKVGKLLLHFFRFLLGWMGDCLNTSKLDHTTSAFEAIVPVDASERGRRNDED